LKLADLEMTGGHYGAPAVVEAVAAGASDAMLITSTDGRIAFANAAAETLLDSDRNALRGTPVNRLLTGISSAIRTISSRRFAPPIDSEEKGWQGAAPILRVPGHEPTPVAIRISSAAAEGVQYACISIRPESAGDDRAAVESAIDRLEDSGGVIVVDLDHFELVNQGLGRSGGDAVLDDLASALSAAARRGETVAHLEADRFALVTAAADLPGRAEQLLDAIRSRRVRVGESTVRLTASAGISAVDEPRRSGEKLLLAAEAAVHTAKEQGGDRSHVERIGAGIKARPGLDWNDRIRSAIEGGGLIAHFQPILEIGTGRISHLELLARLRDPDGSLVEPGIFIPVAERLGMVGWIDRWAVRTAVHTLSRWRANPAGPRIAVNASGRSVGSPQLIDCVHESLRRTGLDGNRLVIEVTETAAIGSIESAAEFGDELQRLGVGFSLDDFGTGFGTFYYLKHLPLDQVKIDGEFIREIVASPSDQAFVTSLVAMARGRDVKTVAEFVADEEVLSCVRALGIDYAQGYLIGRPQPLAPGPDGPGGVARPA